MRALLKENLLVQLSLVALAIMVTFGVVISATSGAMLHSIIVDHDAVISSPINQESLSEDINKFRWLNLGILAASCVALYAGLVLVMWRGSGIWSKTRSRLGAFNAELEQLQNRIDEVAAIDQIARIFASTLSIPDVCDEFTRELKKLVEFDRAFVSYIDPIANTFRVEYSMGTKSESRRTLTDYPLMGSQAEYVSTTGETLIKNRPNSEPVFPDDYANSLLGLVSSIAVPLSSKGIVIGCLMVRSRQADRFGARERAILERLAEQIAPALENSELYEQMKEQTEAMALVDEVARIITSTLKIEEVYQQIALEMKKLIDFDRTSINTINRQDGTFTLRYVYGPVTSTRPLGVPVSMSNTHVEEVFKSGKPLRRAIPAVTPEYSTDAEWAALGIKSTLLIPLIFRGEVIGTFSLRGIQSDAYGAYEQNILERLAKQIAPAIENARLFEQSKAAEEQLSKLSCAVEQISCGVLITDIEGTIQYVNPKFTAITGYTSEEVVGGNPRMFDSGQTLREHHQELWETISSGQEWRGEFHNRRKNGELYWAAESISPIRSSEGKITHYVAVEEDVTEKKQLEEQFLQAQKMESVGRLAGGVAHDFNNLLTIILGYSQMAKVKALSGEDVGSYLDETIGATERAANLTSQLLAFSRKQHIEPRVINLNDLVLNLDKMLRRLISEDIELVVIPSAALASIKIDPSQMEQVLMNLAVNARDAMPEGGKLIIRTANHPSDEVRAGQKLHPFSAPCVVLSVGDSGIGMSDEVKLRLFEPFFTTKGVGEGTGLGLSTCYGIAEQMGGFIEVESEPSWGTTFKIHIPTTQEMAVSINLNQDDAAVPRGSETILIAEDETALRAMVVQTLRSQGYDVLEASNGDEALRLTRVVPQTIHALVTDVIMPGVGGSELAEQICAARPDIKVLFTSGYTEGINNSGKKLPQDAAFLQKPYMPDTLATKVREVLDS